SSPGRYIPMNRGLAALTVLTAAAVPTIQKVRQTSVISAIFHRIILAKVRMVRHWPAAGTRRDMT
ncbi:hypothetical protein, partial [Paracoccus sp. S4493]|uniref:hypothetical protein n=1 Tax=Paracoccus sp. S4493 TaxID=579490 RepID=UPI00194FD3C7